jgi:hypothetical protein
MDPLSDDKTFPAPIAISPFPRSWVFQWGLSAYLAGLIVAFVYIRLSESHLFQRLVG